MVDALYIDLYFSLPARPAANHRKVRRVCSGDLATKPLARHRAAWIE
jgi:hypothetical protein